MSNLTDSVQEMTISEMTQQLLLLFTELDGITNKLCDNVKQVWGAEDIDRITEPFLLAMDKLEDELTRIVALNIRENISSYKTAV